MLISMRRFGAVAVGCLATLGSLGAPALAQRMPILGNQFTVVPGQTPFHPNTYLSNGQTLGQFAFNTALLGTAQAQVPPWLLGYNPYPNPILNNGTSVPSAYGGYGAGYPTAGYGSLLATTGYGNPPAGYGGGAGYGYGAGYSGGAGYSSAYAAYSNPYNGYLTGAADLTTAQAKYDKIIQEGRLVQEQANRSYYDTRRKIVEEAMYERNKWTEQYNPELVRQRDMASDLDRARHDPPLTDILSGKALNVLLNHVAVEQANGQMGRNVPLYEDLLKNVNLTGNDNRANAGLLKYERLPWPLSLEGAEFKDDRDQLSKLFAEAVDQLKNNNPVPAGKIQDMRAELDRMNDSLRRSVGETSPSQYIEARRFLNDADAAVRALQDPNASNYFNGNWAANKKNVAELVKYMTERGLVFAPAVSGDVDAYRALYRALQAFDAGVVQVQATAGNGRYP